jgi:hypothetical protein
MFWMPVVGKGSRCTVRHTLTAHGHFDLVRSSLTWQGAKSENSCSRYAREEHEQQVGS